MPNMMATKSNGKINVYQKERAKKNKFSVSNFIIIINQDDVIKSSSEGQILRLLRRIEYKRNVYI